MRNPFLSVVVVVVLRGLLGCRCPPPSCEFTVLLARRRVGILECAARRRFGGVRHSLVEEAAGCQASLLKPLSASRAESAGRFSRKTFARWVSGVRTVIFTSPPRSDRRTSTRRSPPVTSNFMSRTEVPFAGSGLGLGLHRILRPDRFGRSVASGCSGDGSAFIGASGVCGIILPSGRDGGSFGMFRRRFSGRRSRPALRAWSGSGPKGRTIFGCRRPASVSGGASSGAAGGGIGRGSSDREDFIGDSRGDLYRRHCLQLHRKRDFAASGVPATRITNLGVRIGRTGISARVEDAAVLTRCGRWDRIHRARQLSAERQVLVPPRRGLTFARRCGSLVSRGLPGKSLGTVICTGSSTGGVTCGRQGVRLGSNFEVFRREAGLEENSLNRLEAHGVGCGMVVGDLTAAPPAYRGAALDPVLRWHRAAAPAEWAAGSSRSLGTYYSRPDRNWFRGG